MFRCLVLLLFFILFASTGHAQGAWETWLYESGTLRMILINQEGVLLDEFPLPFPTGYDYNYHSQVTVSPDGNYFAYVVGKSGTNDQMLVIYNYAAKGIVGMYEPPDVSYSGIPAFNQDSTKVAFGNSTNANGWEIIVVELASMGMSNFLSSLDPIASDVDANAFLTPYIQSYNGERIAFTQVLSAAGGALFYDNFVWSPAANTVTPSIGYGQIGSDIYPITGETLITLHDINLPDNPDPYTAGYANTLNVYDPTSRVRFPFYADPVTSLGQGYFVQNGLNVLASEYDGVSTTWFVVSRDGNRIADMPAVQIDTAAGTPDGFIYTSSETGTPELRKVDLVNSSLGLGEVLFTGASDSFLSIVWVGLRGGEAFSTGDYPAWLRLTDPTTEGGAVVIEQPIIENDTVLRINGRATVNTTEGDNLNVRSAAGTEFAIRAKLKRGTIVTLMEGPVDADGFTWWLIRTADGTEGWAVDSADNEQTLVPGTTTTTNNTNGQVDEETEGGADPSVQSQLEVGDDAIVSLTGQNDVLRLRNNPGTDARVVMLMPNGLRVRVVDGPRNTGGYTWWQLRTPEGNVGWAAEVVGRERVLVETTNVVITSVAPTSAATLSVTPSATNTDTLGTAVLLSPLPGTVISDFPRSITFSWEPVTGATHYNLEIEGCPADNSGCVPFKTISNLTTTSHTEIMPGDGLGRWRIVTVSSGEQTTTAWWSFTVDTSAGTLDAPVLVSPPDGSELTNSPRITTLTWQPLTGATSYEVEVMYCDADENCGSYPVVSTSGTEYTFEFVGAQPGQWRVRAVGSGGVPGPWSDWWTFVYTA